MKTSHVLVAFGAFALGVGTGAYVAHRVEAIRATSSDTRLLTGTLAADVGTDIAYLYRLRDGRIDPVRSVLEMRLDSDLVMLGERIAALPATERDPQQLKTIQMHKDYRERFPYTNSVPAISEGVLKAYALLGDTSKNKP